MLQMTGAKDPDEYVLKYGAEHFRKLMDNSISYAEYKINRLKSSYNLSDTTEKIKFLTKMAEILSKINNNIERDIYVDKYSKELGVGKEAILAEIEKKTLRSTVQSKQFNNISQNFLDQNSVSSNTSRINEDMIIYLLSKNDEGIYKSLKENIDVGLIHSDVKKQIILKLYDLYETGNIKNRTIDSVCKTDEEFNIFTEIMMNENMNEDTEKILSEVIKSFTLENLQRRRNDLMKKLTNISTNEERESIAIELNEINTKLGQLMIR